MLCDMYFFQNVSMVLDIFLNSFVVNHDHDIKLVKISSLGISKRRASFFIFLIDFFKILFLLWEMT